MISYQLAALFLALALPFLSPGSARAGWDEGVAAYDRGDYHAAFREFMALAVAGDSSAQVNIGLMYRLGQGVPQNDAEAVRWYRMAATQGEAQAQFNLGVMYERGQGVPQDYAVAVRWYRMAADQGDANAQTNLGWMYGRGQGVPQDYAEAVRWYRMAADQGDTHAQHNLGLAYARGRGVPQDDVRAYMWLNLAAARSPQGEDRTRTVELRDEVAARLSPAQRALGQELARNWRLGVATTSKGGPRDYGQAGSNPFQAEIERRANQNREAQQLLADLGYDPGPVDGVVGPKTRAAILAFQVDLGLPVDGQISDELIAALRDAAVSGQRVSARPAPMQPRLDDTAPSERYGAAAPAPIQRRLDSTGTGFAVSEDGHLLTNHHVIDGCAEVRVRPPGQEAAAGVVVARDPGNDLALLETPTRLPAAVLRADGGIRAGDSVVAVGFPLPELLAFEANVTTGTVSALAGIGNDARFLQMTVPVQPGNSGGPLLDLQGRVVGVVVGKLDAVKVASVTGDIPQNVNFAIKAGVLRSFLDASAVGVAPRAPLAEPAYPIQLSPASVGADAKAFAVLVECWK